MSVASRMVLADVSVQLSRAMHCDTTPEDAMQHTKAGFHRHKGRCTTYIATSQYQSETGETGGNMRSDTYASAFAARTVTVATLVLLKLTIPVGSPPPTQALSSTG